MELIADGLLIAGALAAALYCWVLSRRVQSLKDLEGGLGGAISGLSAQVEDTRASLNETTQTTNATTRDLAEITARAEIAAGRLELLLASVHEREEETRVDREDVLRKRAAVADVEQIADDDEPAQEVVEPVHEGIESDREGTPADRRIGTPPDDKLLDALRNIVDGMNR